nr:hypothetical protein [Campylobacter jejuni]
MIVFDAIIDVASLCCNDREKSKNIFTKAIRKLKKGGKFYSSALSKQAFGYEADKGDFSSQITEFTSKWVLCVLMMKKA